MIVRLVDIGGIVDCLNFPFIIKYIIIPEYTNCVPFKIGQSFLPQRM